MEILSGGITLRPWLISDAPALASLANEEEIARNLRDGFPNPYSLSDAIEWLNMTIPGNDPPRFFAVEVGGVLAGSIGLVTKTDVYRRNIEIGYFLGREFRGRGIGTKAIRAATSYAFRQFDIVRVYAEVYADNPASARALEKAGYTLEARLRKNVYKNGTIKDSLVYSVLREEFLF